MIYFYFYFYFSPNEQRAGGGGGGRCQTFSFSFFPCSADHEERDWPPCKVVFFGLATNALNVRNNNNPIKGDYQNVCQEPIEPARRSYRRWFFF